jgi:hypothetical protein
MFIFAAGIFYPGQIDFSFAPHVVKGSAMPSQNVSKSTWIVFSRDGRCAGQPDSLRLPQTLPGLLLPGTATGRRKLSSRYGHRLGPKGIGG